MKPQNINVALVDDHTLIREGIKMLIQMIPGYTVVLECSNGRELADKLSGTTAVPVDVVLLDVRMPEMDGYETAAWLTQHKPDIKILALSTMDEETSIIKMIQNGAKGYVLKNVATEELKRAVSDVLEKGFYFNEQVSQKVISSLQGILNNNSTVATLLQLNENEKQFIHLACTEMSYAEIAKEMNLSPRTIDGYRDTLFEKFEVKTRVGLVLFAVKHGIVTL